MPGVMNTPTDPFFGLNVAGESPWALRMSRGSCARFQAIAPGLCKACESGERIRGARGAFAAGRGSCSLLRMPVDTTHRIRVETRKQHAREGAPPTSEAPVCASCGDPVQARLDKIGEVPFCPACRERARPPDPDEDVGVGD